MESNRKTSQPGCFIVLIAGVLCLLAITAYVLSSAMPAAVVMTPTSVLGPTFPIVQMTAASTGPGDTGGENADLLARVDEALEQSLSASIAYNAPESIPLDETVTIQLLLNPSVDPPNLAEEVTEPGEVVTTSIQVTPRMRAELIARDSEALLVQPLQVDPEQFISATETTPWEWDVTAKKPGTHRLTLVVHRLVTVDGTDSWRRVGAYRSDIEVKVKPVRQVSLPVWMWAAGIAVLALAAVPIVFVLYRRRRLQAPTGSRAVGPHGRIFLSYRRSDSADIAGRIYDRLVAAFGREPIFKDVDSIPLGTDFREYLDRKVGECSVLLAIIGDRWLEAVDASGKRRLEDPDDFVRVEIESALERGIAVIPLLVRGAHMPEEEQLPSGLQKLVYKNGIPIRPDPDFHNDMDRLISSLKRYV